MKQPALFKRRRGRVNADHPSSLAASPFEGQARQFNSRTQAPQLGDEKALASAFALLDKQVTNSKSEFGWRKWVLPDGRVARLVVDQSGTDTTRRIEIPAPTPPKEPEKEEKQEEEEFKPLTLTAVHRFGFPDYACGAVFSPTLREIEIPAPTEENPDAVEVIEIINGVELTEEGHYRVFYEDSQAKLAIALPVDFATLQDFIDQSERGIKYSIHHRVKSGLYTGYMRKLIQLLLGLGKIQTKTYEKRRIKAGDCEVIAPDGYAPIKEIGKKWGLYRSFYKLYATRKDDDPQVEIKFQYGFGKTHGLTKAESGQCYVIEIGIGGAYAWELEIDPLSKTPAGRRRCEFLYPEFFEIDSSGQSLFDYFGGFPSGDLVPLQADREKLINAGEILELKKDMSKFYSNSFFSSEQGWAFAETAKEAVHTCWRVNDQQYKVAMTFAFHWFIAGSKEELFEEESQRVRDTRNAMKELGILEKPWYERKLLRIEEEWGSTQSGPLREFYMDCMSALDSLSRGDEVTKEDKETLLETFHAIKVTPKFQYSGRLVKQQEGVVYSPTRYNPPYKECANYYAHYHPQIKFPEPILGCLLSFDFSVADKDSAGPEPELCDAPVWVGFFRDQKIQINYWRMRQEYSDGSYYSSTREECQFTGKWTIEKARGLPYIAGNFYATDFDLRKTINLGAYEKAEYTGWDAGTEDYYLFRDFFGTCCDITRTVHFDFSYTKRTISGKGFRSAIAIPFNDRSIYYSAKLETIDGARLSEGSGGVYSAGRTGYTRYGHVYHFICHWQGVGCPQGQHIGPDPSECIMREIIPMKEPGSSHCLAGYGPPGFPYYRPCGEEPDGSMNFSSIGSMGCVYSAYFNKNVAEGFSFNEGTNAENILEWEVRIHGDTHIGGKKVAFGKVAEEGADIFETKMSTWWFMTCPNSCDMRTTMKVSVNRWGNDLICYDPQLDPFTTGFAGLPESMYLGSNTAYVGHVSDRKPGDE